VLQGSRSRLVGAENPVTSRDLHILVDESAEPVASQRQDDRSGGWRGAACGRALIQRSVRTMGVVMLDVLAQHDVEVAGAGDQEVVEAFPTQGADEAFPRSHSPAVPGSGCG
jgi:hypothetical protein